jgi:hypothetical protein
MAAKLRITPEKPCCQDCVIGAFDRARFDYKQPFVMVSGLGREPARKRAALLDALLTSEGAEVFVIISVPSPEAAPGDEKEEAAVVGDDEPLDETTLRQVLGIDPDAKDPV